MIAAHKGGNHGGVGRLRPGRRLSDRAHRHPGGVVAVGHPALRLVQKAILQLGGAPLLMRPGPGARHQALGSGDRARVESAVGEVVAKFVVLVGDHQHVIADPLGEARDLGLNREVAGIGPPRARDKGPGFLFDDVRLELQCGVPDVGGKFAVAVTVADDEQQIGPALDDKILNQRVGQHRPARQQVQDVRAAIRAAQPVIGRTGVEDRDVGGVRQGGDCQQLLRIEIGHDKPHTLCHEVAESAGNVAAFGRNALDELEGLAGELTGGVVVGDTETSPLDPLVLRRLVEIGQRQCPFHRLRQPPDLHGLSSGANTGHRRGHHAQSRQPAAAESGSNCRSSPMPDCYFSVSR